MSLEQIFRKTIAFGFYLLFFLTPLVFNPFRLLPSYELFEWNKMMFVYALTVIIVGAWAGRMIISRKIIFEKTPFQLPLLLFLGSQSLSTLFSIDPHVSIFGYYSRFHGGLLSTLAYTLLYFAFVSNRKSINFRMILTLIFVSAISVTAYGLAQRLGVDAHIWVQDVRNRVFSTFGQPNWLAAYLAVILPLFLSWTTPFIKHFVSKGGQNNSVSPDTHIKIVPPLIYFLLHVAFYVCLLYTKSRSGFLGFWTAYFIYWFALFFLRRKEKQTFVKIFSVTTLIYLITNFWIKTPFPVYNRIATIEVLVPQSSTPVIEAPIGDTLINVGVTDSTKIRQIVWKGAFAIIRNYPVFGTGPETFAFAYYKYRPAEHNLTSEWDFLYNRAHNEFLNIAATQGLTGIITYLVLLVYVVIFFMRQLKHLARSSDAYLFIALFAAYAGIAVTNFFGFSVVVIGLYFFLIPAFLFNIAQKPAALTNTPADRITAALQLHPLIQIKIWLISLFIAELLLLYLLSRMWLVDSLYARASSFSRQEKYAEAYPYITTAVKMRPGEPVYHDERANIAGNLATIAFATQEATLGARLAQEAIDESSTALSTSPQNVSFWKTRTRILHLLSGVEPSFIEKALQSILIARELAPTDAKIAYNTAVIYGKAGKNKEAIEVLEETIRLKPDYRDAYIALSIFYEDEKQIDKARQTLELVLTRINPDDVEVKERMQTLK